MYNEALEILFSGGFSQMRISKEMIAEIQVQILAFHLALISVEKI